MDWLPRRSYISDGYASDRITEFTLSQDESLEGAISWFAQFGPTHTDYLRSHFDALKLRVSSAMADVPAGIRLRILDVGAHWLHNAFFYANRGTTIVTDAVDTLEEVPRSGRRPRRWARRSISLLALKKGTAFVRLPDDSIDIVLFCEVIEHLAFNPIPFWKQVYRVLKPWWAHHYYHAQCILPSVAKAADRTDDER